MKQLKKQLSLFLLLISLSLAFVPAVYAQGVIPSDVGPGKTCEDILKEKKKSFESKEGFEQLIAAEAKDVSRRELIQKLLGCAVKSGRIHLFMVPYFITYLIGFLMRLASLISILFIVIGGYNYVVGGLIEDKESGKKTLVRALTGLAVSLSGWIIVDFVLIALTS